MVVAFPKAGLPVPKITDFELTLTARRQETSDVVTFCFEVSHPKGLVFRHLPGQAVAVTFPMPLRPASRTFTIASSGLRENYAELTIKAASDGVATRWAHEHLKLGDSLNARGPLGRFSLTHAPKQPLLLIGAGSGLTPMMSMLRWLHERGEDADVVFIQVVRHVEDLLFRDELTKINSNMMGLARFDLITRLNSQTDWNGYRGRMNSSILSTMAPDAPTRTVFCCGPHGFMEMFEDIYVAGMGGVPDRFHKESFGVSVAPPSARATSQLSQHDGFKGTIDGLVFHAGPHDTLLEAVASAGKRIPSGCREGRCGTCRVQLLEGEVDMTHQQGINPKEEASGIILACCSRAKSDLVLKTL